MAVAPRTTGAVLVLGGGVAGIQCALDLAEGGYKVHLVEKDASLGGHMAQLDKTFPTNDCSMCTMSPKLVEIGRHKDVDIITLADIKGIEGSAGNFSVTVHQRPRYVDEDKCTGCGICTTNCPTHAHVQPQPMVEPVLEAGTQERVDAILAKHQDRNGSLMPILQEINSAYNHFPTNVLEYVSLRTDRSLADVYHIATFYSSFSITPRGKHMISVCMGTTCYVRGSQQLMEKVSDVLEVEPDETTPDMMFTLKPVRCIGCCGLAPALMIDDKVYGKLTAKEIPAIVKRYREDS
jgi:NADH:ubiquinone oxidoreductase subunit E/NAD-dependent dihydropyrimidine dehydrogenase PreA subunit